MNFKDFKKLDPEAGKYLSLLVRVGAVMMGCILLGLFIGLYVVKKADASAIHVVPWILGGVFCGFYYLSQELWKL